MLTFTYGNGGEELASVEVVIREMLDLVVHDVAGVDSGELSEGEGTCGLMRRLSDSGSPFVYFMGVYLYSLLQPFSESEGIINK